jgi:hypothetical protein
MVVILGFLGLGIDMGYLRYMKRQVQKVADAAAVAAAVELNYCTNNCTQLQTAAQNALTENGFTSSAVVAQVCNGAGSGSSANLVLIINNPPCYLGSKTADPHYNDPNYVEVLVSQIEPLAFASVVGIKQYPITARAEGGLAGGSNCIFALDPTDSGTITVALLAAVTSKCGIVDESSSNSALQCDLFALISASQIGIVGNDQSFLCSISPKPVTGIAVPNPTDPLANLPEPSVGSCGTTTASPYTGYPGTSGGLNVTGTATLNPGVYCGGINLGNSARATFNPGTYILTTPTAGATYGLNVDLGGSATGSGVTFYNTQASGKTGGPIHFTFSVLSGTGVNFTAPTSGTYEGILFFQDPSNTQTAQIIGSPDWNTTLEGTYYFPRATVQFAFDGPVSYNILDAWKIDFFIFTWASGNLSSSGFSNNYSSLADGSPVKGSGGVVVE